MIKITGIDFESIVDGHGVRVVIFFSGCKHNCQGCHNPATHDFDAGSEFTLRLQDQIIQYVMDTPFISGVTLSGGDPLYTAHDILPFVKRLKSSAPDKSIWIYSGFSYEEILKSEDMVSLLNWCDVLVDGRFILEQKTNNIPYIGSRNQRVIDLRRSEETGVPTLLQ